MSAFLAVAVAQQLGVMSPGPDFALVSKNSLCSSRSSGLWTAFGIAAGASVHSTYCLMGLGFVISRSILLFNLIKYAGAAYLLYLGWKALTSKSALATVDSPVEKRELAPAHAFRNGFVCNVLNPKCTLWFLAIFTQVIDPATPLLTQMGYSVYLVASTLAWFSFVALVLSTSVIQKQFRKVQAYFERAMGVVLIALGLKIALTRD